MRKLIMWSILCIVLVLGTGLEDSYAGVKVLKWNLVDSGKHLDWDGTTKYMKQFKEAIKVWNNYKKGVIREDNVFRIQDVVISDCVEVSCTAGITGSNGVIRFNQYIMDKLSYNSQKNVCIHELGHALGLEHNTSNDVMYMYTTNRINLSYNDKLSYDYVYKKLY